MRTGELLVYIYLQYQKSVGSGQCYPSYITIGEAVGMTRQTVQKYIGALADKGLIHTENTSVRWKDGLVYNGNLLYTLTPVRQVLRERERELLVELKLAEAQRKWAEKVNAMPPRPSTSSGKNYYA